MAFSILRIIREFDDFGYPIQLTYKGSHTNQSWIGGLISLLVIVLTLVMTITKVQQVIEMS